jgi:hypothetical protein
VGGSVRSVSTRTGQARHMLRKRPINEIHHESHDLMAAAYCCQVSEAKLRLNPELTVPIPRASSPLSRPCEFLSLERTAGGVGFHPQTSPA